MELLCTKFYRKRTELHSNNTNPLMQHILALFTLLVCFNFFANAQKYSVSGKVQDTEGEAVFGAQVKIEELKRGTITSIDGNYSIEDLPAGKYHMTVSFIGYKTLSKEIELSKNLTLPPLTLEEDTRSLDNVIVESNSATTVSKTSGYNIAVINTEELQDINLDINQVLNLSSGVNIRQSGGLGSNFNLMINGLSGNQIRYFIDGIPMENFGPEMRLNNFPANLIRSVELYKGVTPIELSGDALGGSINVVTPSLNEDFVDASYSFGSFNTHRTSFFGQVTNDKGLFARLSSFYNYSDNNYYMNGVSETDEFGNIIGTLRVRRFHDAYSSFYANSQLGVTNKPFANLLSVNFIYGSRTNEIQHPEVSVNRIYGGLNEKGHSLTGLLRYEHKLSNGLELKSYFMASHVTETLYDTLSRRYDWRGNYNNIENGRAEFYTSRSIFEVTDFSRTGGLTAKYRLFDNHQIIFNGTYRKLDRNGNDEINPNNRSFSTPNELSKTILGISYDFSLNESKTVVSTFSKSYWFGAKINVQEYESDSESITEANSNLNEIGYGLTIRHQLLKPLSIKASYEKAYRLPEPNETLGDGALWLSNPDLQPENSNNVDLGLSFSQSNARYFLSSELNFFYRPARDFIVFVNERGIYGRSLNVGNVRVLGIETNNQIRINNYSFNLSLTYQDITDQTPFDEGLPNTNMGNKVPNIPYLFWNVGAKYDYTFKQNKLSLLWTTMYTHEFFLYWENLGYRSEKNKIPSQFTHDLNITYSIVDGKYSLSLGIQNLFDELNYDNYNVQKPGRSFSAKARYFLNL